ncbi:MAG TPA: mechanosensitive ion channel protein MscS, partial [Marinilabiliaceae bacterium]|nr:mechanosensitive ion channel protein MscS [Marinilabiliaceae bacterium]
VLLHYAVKLVNKTKSKRDDFLIKRKVLHRFSHVVPAIIIYLLSKSLFAVYPDVGRILTNFAVIYMVAVIFLTISALLNVVEDIYNTKEYSAERPIKSYLQLINIILYFVGGILLLAYLFNLEVAGIFTGLGAMAAVLMLIFKDTILGLVASIQLSTNKMLRVGDWISMPSHNADGDVLEVTLNTVKVQNWDKTITTIPTYALINSPFMNWRGMSE